MSAKQNFGQNIWGDYFYFILSGDEFKISLKSNYRYKYLRWIRRLCDPVVFHMFFCAVLFRFSDFFYSKFLDIKDIIQTEVLKGENKIQIQYNLVYVVQNP